MDGRTSAAVAVGPSLRRSGLPVTARTAFSRVDARRNGGGIRRVSGPAAVPWEDRGVPRWQHALACRVVIQAFRDLRDHHGLLADRTSAREFLAGSSMLRYWCHVGSLDLRRITALARRR